MFALANTEEVKVMEAKPNSHTEFLKLPRQTTFYNKKTQSLDHFQPLTPCISWGYGYSPVL